MLWLLGCTATPPAPPPPAPAPVESVVVTEAAPTLQGEAPTGAVVVELQFVGVGGLHKRYFADSDVVTELAGDLATCLRDRAVIRVSYDSENRIGEIRLMADAAQLTCTARRSGDTVELGALKPLGEALAGYRDTLAGRFDFRLSSFAVKLEALSGTHGCLLELSGQFPPDGSTWNPCPELGGEHACPPKRGEGATSLALGPAEAAYLARCLGG